MTDLEKLEVRIEAVDTAMFNVKVALNVDRKLSHDKHSNGHFTNALDELMSVRTQLSNLKLRIETVGR